MFILFKHLNGIHISKVTKLWSTILNVDIAHCQVRTIKMWKKCVKESMRTDNVQLMMCNIMVRSNAY